MNADRAYNVVFYYQVDSSLNINTLHLLAFYCYLRRPFKEEIEILCTKIMGNNILHQVLSLFDIIGEKKVRFFFQNNDLIEQLLQIINYFIFKCAIQNKYPFIKLPFSRVIFLD
jgi:hypothetical protein